MSINQNPWGYGETFALVSVILAALAFITPEVRCALNLPSEACPYIKQGQCVTEDLQLRPL